MNLWISSIDKAINDALNNLYNGSCQSNGQNSNGSFHLNLSNDIINSNLEDSGSNDTTHNEFLDSIDIAFSSSSFHSDPNNANNSSHTGNNSHNASSNHLLNTTSSTKNLRDYENNSNSSHLLNNSHNKTINSKKNSENKNYLLTQVKGNQNCCDCGAPTPTWVNIINFFEFHLNQNLKSNFWHMLLGQY